MATICVVASRHWDTVCPSTAAPNGSRRSDSAASDRCRDPGLTCARRRRRHRRPSRTSRRGLPGWRCPPATSRSASEGSGARPAPRYAVPAGVSPSTVPANPRRVHGPVKNAHRVKASRGTGARPDALALARPRRKLGAQGPVWHARMWDGTYYLQPHGSADVMTPRAGRTPKGRRASTRSRARVGPGAHDLVIVSRSLADLADFLQERQASVGRGLVILDRRVGDRRTVTASVREDRRRSDRRRAASESAEALMRVLGFTVVRRPAPSGDAATRRAVSRPRRITRAPAKSRQAAPTRRPRRRRR